MLIPDELRPLVIRGGSFTFRTFADGYFGLGSGGRRSATIDRLVTVTLPAVSGADHKIVPSMEVRLYSDKTINERRRHAGAYVDGRSARSAITAETIAEIRRLALTETKQAIADRFGLPRATVSDIVLGKTHREIA